MASSESSMAVSQDVRRGGACQWETDLRETDLCKFEAWSSGHSEPQSDTVPKEGRR